MKTEADCNDITEQCEHPHGEQPTVESTGQCENCRVAKKRFLEANPRFLVSWVKPRLCTKRPNLTVLGFLWVFRINTVR